MTLKKSFLRAATASIFLAAPGFAAADAVETMPVASPDPVCPEGDIPQTRHSKMVAAFQAQFGAGRTGIDPVLYLDRDEIERRARQLAHKDGFRDKTIVSRREAALQIYIEEKAGVTILPANAARISQHLTAGTPMAVWQGGLSGGINIVIPMSPDYPMHMIHAETFDEKKSADFAGLKSGIYGMWRASGMDVETHARWINHHETAHGMDKAFNMRVPQPQMWSSVLQRHKTEMFADVVSVLQMAKEGKKNTFPFMREMRVILAYHQNQQSSFTLLKDVMSGNFADLVGKASAAVYWTVPGLDAANALVEKLGPEGLQKMSTEDIMRASEAIVNQQALDLAAAQGVILASAFHRENSPAALKTIEWYIQKAPDPARRAILQQVETVWRSGEAATLAAKNQVLAENMDASAAISTPLVDWQAELAEMAAQPGSADSGCDAVERALPVIKDRLRDKINSAATREKAEADLLALQKLEQEALLGALRRNTATGADRPSGAEACPAELLADGHNPEKRKNRQTQP